MVSNIFYPIIIIILIKTRIFECANTNLSVCKSQIQTDLPTKEPIYLTKYGKLLVPSGEYLNWNIGDLISISCMSGSNTITIVKRPEVNITCTTNNKFNIETNNYTLAELECKTPITGDVLSTAKSCAYGGQVKHIGFNTSSFGFIKFIDICYDTQNATVIYTRHEIKGAAIDFAEIQKRGPFKKQGMPSSTNPNLSYRQNYQKSRLAQLLGSTTEASKYITNTSFLARGHLVPDADGIFKTWQAATYFYLNVAPQWQVVNNGNWLRVERIARKIGSFFKKNLTIYTGVAGVLTLKDINGNNVKITLEANGKIPVPKWLWKIVVYKRSGIAFLTLNNPFEKLDKICEDICSEYDWDVEKFNDVKIGLTYCCSVPDALRALKLSLPISNQIKILRNILNDIGN